MTTIATSSPGGMSRRNYAIGGLNLQFAIWAAKAGRGFEPERDRSRENFKHLCAVVSLWLVFAVSKNEKSRAYHAVCRAAWRIAGCAARPALPGLFQMLQRAEILRSAR